MKFKVGERVVVIDEALVGIVSEISEDTVTVETDDGFKLSFSPSELIKELSIPTNVFADKSLKSVIQEKETFKKNKSVRIRPKERNLPAMEVDLHIEQITTRFKSLSNFDILNLQMDTARYKLEFGIKKRIQKIVFIHGVGDGVLKAELESLFRRYNNLKFYPADYQKYGQGATEVYIAQKNSNKNAY